VTKPFRRTPKNYDGSELTTHQMTDVLPHVLAKISEMRQDRSDLILASWPDVIGPQLAPLTQAVSFKEGVLVVKVKNSTLYSLLNQNDKPKILNRLRQKFPNVAITNIYFRIT
jgi:hypothetical protein